MRAFLRAEWRTLAMLNYAVDPALLLPHVPRGTSLDLWQGEAIASLVGFKFLDTRVLGVRVPAHVDFEEVNLRFYVRRVEGDEVRRGVVFIRELVPRRAIAWTAQLWYNEPYCALPMRHAVRADANDQHVSYEWRDGGEWMGLRAHTRGAPEALVPGSEAEFITEHYWGYTAQRDGGTIEYSVQHPSWRVWKAVSAEAYGSLERTYGALFARTLSSAPRSAFVAEGSPITVGRPRRLARSLGLP